MEIYEFDHELVQEKTQMFPDEICDDFLTAYHPTSSIFEDDIDSLGLQWQPHVVRRTEVDAVVSIFEEMNWDGAHRGGIAVLKPFSQEFDFGCSHTKPIFLAEPTLESGDDISAAWF